MLAFSVAPGRSRPRGGSSTPDRLNAVPVHLQPPGTFGGFSEQVRSILDAMSGEQFFRSNAHGGWRPRINVYEVADRYYICAELAGMPLQNIELRVEEGHLHLRGVRPKPALPRDESEVSVHLMEIDSGPFERTLGLPRDVDAGRIEARYRDGLLWIELPRRPSTEREHG